MLNSEMLSFSPFQPRARLGIRGEDAATFLQGQFTNDLLPLRPGEAAYGLWLNQKGKVLADSFVLRDFQEERFFVGSYFSPATVIRERLEAYVIADDVTIEDVTSIWTGFAILGSGVAARFSGIAPNGFVFPGRRVSGENIECIVPIDESERVRSEILRAGAKPISTSDLEQLRIQANIPAIPQDIGPGELPNEGGLETVAISYTKGCYLGQEVMARLKSMGQVRRRLLRVVGEGVIPTLPAPLFLGVRAVGELRSAVLDGGSAGFAGLALVSLLHVRPDSLLALTPEGPAAIRLVEFHE
jgi:folate-binding protein YgfZ